MIMRFQYSWYYFAKILLELIVQINDRYEFPLELDLDRDDGKYLSPDADRSVRNLYTLHRYEFDYLFIGMNLITCWCWKDSRNTDWIVKNDEKME